MFLCLMSWSIAQNQDTSLLPVGLLMASAPVLLSSKLDFFLPVYYRYIVSIVF